ncbi:tRNA (guanine-N(7)-)-methyltransferase [Stackebrandtia albiflava]|uniref:tRNA (guanine-N(7)-)-methyltransferase n=1 Tax=Stackebrandtia albiflava TaxID=406432 RepID=A0A562V1N2_9ACTN|nr:tRNA (guanosine(46)-N7)-methyltransferase TrmB [Stackebrandtia albiflava]TWJ11830.1 tRNA (guanine-N(7)-)-methyltransferase [Stackebrandtia albiflava]
MSQDLGERSFYPRRGRVSKRHLDALHRLYPVLGVPAAPLSAGELFGRHADVVVEIGSGMGEATVAMAAADPGRDHIAVEVHPPGVGNLLAMAEETGLRNLRVHDGDAVEFLARHVPPDALAEIRVFFPDPWPKARHHKRRLIRPANVALLRSRLRPGGVLHCATDWPQYAEVMMEVLGGDPQLRNLHDGAAPRPEWRPVTKFEERAVRAGRPVTDLRFTRVPVRHGRLISVASLPGVEAHMKHRPLPFALPAYLVLTLALGGVVWWLLYTGSHEASQVAWYCYGSECSTDDFRGAMPVIGGILAVPLAAAAWPLLRGAAPGVSLLVAAAAVWTGFTDAIRDYGVTEDSVVGWRIAALVVGGLAAVQAVVAFASALRTSGVGNAWRGRRSAAGRVHRYENPHDAKGPAVVSFMDAFETRHDVPVTVRRELVGRPVTVWYDPTSPQDSTRVSVGEPQWSMVGRSRDQVHTRLRELLPVPEDHRPEPASDEEDGATGPVDLAGQLDRLAALHRRGDLTDAEFSAAKRRLLG